MELAGRGLHGGTRGHGRMSLSRAPPDFTMRRERPAGRPARAVAVAVPSEEREGARARTSGRGRPRLPWARVGGKRAANAVLVVCVRVKMMLFLPGRDRGGGGAESLRPRRPHRRSTVQRRPPPVRAACTAALHGSVAIPFQGELNR